MPEINLLPDDLRNKEKKELESVHKKPKIFSVAMSSPPKETVAQPLQSAQPSLLSRLFAKKIEKPKMSTAPEESGLTESSASIGERAVKTEFTVPKISISDKLAGTKSTAVVGARSQSDSSGQIGGVTNLMTDEEVKIKPAVEISKITDEADEKKESVITQKIKPPSKKWFNFKLFGAKKSAGVRATKLTAGQSEAADQSAVKLKDKRRADKKLKRTAGFLDVNLIPEDLAKHPELELPAKLRNGGIIIGLVILLIFAGYFGVTWYQLNITRQIDDLKIDIKQLDSQITAAQADKESALDLQVRLKLVKELIDRHVYWTKFFAMLEKYTINNVYYTNFAMSGQDKLIISAVGKDYQAVAQQLVAFTGATDFVKTVRIDSASAEVDFATGENFGVSFNISLEFQPGVFTKPIN